MYSGISVLLIFIIITQKDQIQLNIWSNTTSHFIMFLLVCPAFAEDYLINEVDSMDIVTDSGTSYTTTEYNDNVTLISGDIEGSIVKIGNMTMVKMEEN